MKRVICLVGLIMVTMFVTAANTARTEPAPQSTTYQGKTIEWWAKRAVQARKDANARKARIKRQNKIIRYEKNQYDIRWNVVAPYNDKLNRMAHCESTDRWYLDSGNSFYGGLQFTLSTWHSVGGIGYPNENSILEQKYRAVKVILRDGYGAWPHCGYV